MKLSIKPGKNQLTKRTSFKTGVFPKFILSGWSALESRLSGDIVWATACDPLQTVAIELIVA